MNIIAIMFGAVIYNYYYNTNYGELKKSIGSELLFIILCALSFIIAAAGVHIYTGIICFCGVSVIAAENGRKHALSTFGLLVLEYAVIFKHNENHIENIAFFVVNGVILILLLAEIKDKINLIYAAVIYFSLSVVMIILKYHFNIADMLSDKRHIVILCASGVLNFIIVCIYYLRRGICGERESARADKMSEVLDLNNGLMLQLREYSEELYKHSVKIGKLSGAAAEYVEADRELAIAGGYYHEIGRIRDDKNYIDACVEIAKENGFSEQLIDVIRQHSTVSEKPKSVEAAIVMLSDCIVSTSDYLENSGKRHAISDEKLVKSIFVNRISKGNLAEADVSEEIIQKLQDFYIKNAFKMNGDNDI